MTSKQKMRMAMLKFLKDKLYKSPQRLSNGDLQNI
jgi:hypothetical protein